MRVNDLLIKITCSFYFLGYLPLIPGTFGSLGGVILFFAVGGNLLIYGITILTLIVMGIPLCTQAEKTLGKKDSKYIVIDEVTGIMISFFALPAISIKVIVIGFLLFRLLDTIKPYPANKLQDMEGGIGVMGDDIVAGIYTNIILQVALRLASFTAS